MNERVKAIADKIWSLDIEPDSHFNLCLQEFGKLLVKECADLFEVEYGKSEVSGNEVARVLKEHFGVE